MIAVIACPRSGTKYISEALQTVGLDVGHEVEGAAGMVDWKLVAKPDELAKYGTVLHQVRHPLRVIESLHSIKSNAWTFARKHLDGMVKGELRLTQCMRLWLGWNQLCEAKASRTYRVEDLLALHNEILPSLVGKPRLGHKAAAKLIAIPKDLNSRRGQDLPTLTWADLNMADAELTEQIQALAAKYGYTDLA